MVCGILDVVARQKGRIFKIAFYYTDCRHRLGVLMYRSLVRWLEKRHSQQTVVKILLLHLAVSVRYALCFAHAQARFFWSDVRKWKQ